MNGIILRMPVLQFVWKKCWVLIGSCFWKAENLGGYWSQLGQRLSCDGPVSPVGFAFASACWGWLHSNCLWQQGIDLMGAWMSSEAAIHAFQDWGYPGLVNPWSVFLEKTIVVLSLRDSNAATGPRVPSIVESIVERSSARLEKTLPHGIPQQVWVSFKNIYIRSNSFVTGSTYTQVIETSIASNLCLAAEFGR